LAEYGRNARKESENWKKKNVLRFLIPADDSQGWIHRQEPSFPSPQYSVLFAAAAKCSLLRVCFYASAMKSSKEKEKK
jgi:hypothetical protein